MIKVIFEMSNPNTLVSLAYIKTNTNPLSVFCNYVLYLLSVSPDQSLRADDLKRKLAERFGLDMPYQMINNCIRILKKSGEINQLPNGAGYSIGKTQFNTDVFEQEMLRLHEQEEFVLKSIGDFVASHYKLSWTTETAKNYLSAFLDEEGNGARLFLYEEIPANNKKVSPSWYIAKYVNSVQKQTESVEKTYLEEIVNGMMMFLFHVKNAVAVTTEPSAQSTLEPTVEPEPTPEPTTVPPQSIQLPIGP